MEKPKKSKLMSLFFETGDGSIQKVVLFYSFLFSLSCRILTMYAVPLGAVELNPVTGFLISHFGWFSLFIHFLLWIPLFLFYKKMPIGYSLIIFVVMGADFVNDVVVAMQI